VLQDALILSIDNIYEYWVVDLGASFHARHHRKHFLYYVQGDFGQVHVGDDAPCKIVGMCWLTTLSTLILPYFHKLTRVHI
jgi:hypothetical protein